MNLIVLTVSLLCAASCMAAPNGFSLAQMLKMASKTGAKSTRSESMAAGQVTTLGGLDTVHSVGITTHPTESSKLIYADETALYEFDKHSGESRMVAGGESAGLMTHRQTLDGVGLKAEFKFITKIITRSSGVYVFDYDTLRLYTPEDNSVQTVMTLFNPDWMELRGVMTGTVNEAEDKVYFSNLEGFGHFVLSVNIMNGDFSEAELVTAGPSMISSVELSGDEHYVFVGDVDAKTLVRVTIGEPGSEIFVDMEGRSFYPGAIGAMNDEEILVVNTMKKMVDILNTEDLTESDALCHGRCLSNPLDVTVDRNEQVVYVLDSSSNLKISAMKASIKAVSIAHEESQAAGKPANEQQQRYYDFMNHYNKWVAQHPRYAGVW